MKFQELKAKVYELAGVTTPKPLKAKYESIKTLDLRRKASWEKALAIVQEQQNSFENWVENPPDEYQELFAQIKTVSADYSEKLEKVKQIGQEVAVMADSLEELSHEYHEEADRLQQEVIAAKQAAEQSQLN